MGCDASGLELRLLASFMNDPEYIDIVLNGDIHDEVQIEADPDYAQECGEICRQAIIDAGLYFNLNIPMDGAFDIGSSWKDTH